MGIKKLIRGVYYTKMGGIKGRIVGAYSTSIRGIKRNAM